MGWADSDVDTYLGPPDCMGPDGEENYGSDRTYLGGIAIEHIRDSNPGAISVYEQVVFTLKGQFIKLQGFPWLTLIRADSAVIGELIQVRVHDRVEHAEITTIHAAWSDLALTRTRRVDFDDGPAVLSI